MSFSITWLRKNKGINQPDFAFQVEKSTFDFHSFKCLSWKLHQEKHTENLSLKDGPSEIIIEKKDQKKQEKWWPLLNLKWTSYGSLSIDSPFYHIRTSWAPDRPFKPTRPAGNVSVDHHQSWHPPRYLVGSWRTMGECWDPGFTWSRRKISIPYVFFFSRPVSLLF